MSRLRIAHDCVAGPQATPFAKGQLEIRILRTKSLGPRLDIWLMNASHKLRFGVYHSRLLRLQVSFHCIFCLASEGEVTSPTTVIISREIMLEAGRITVEFSSAPNIQLELELHRSALSLLCHGRGLLHVGVTRYDHRRRNWSGWSGHGQTILSRI